MTKKPMWIALASFASLFSAAEAKSFEMYAPDGQNQYIEQFKAAPVVRAGDFIHISGVVGFIRDGEARTPEAYEAAIRDTFRRTEETLAAADAGWDDVIEMTTFHVDLREHQNIFAQVREEFVGEPPFPAWTGIGVEKLWADPLFVEIRVIAYKPQ